MTNGKQRTREILKRLFKDGTIDDVAGNAEKWEQISVDQALDSIEEVVKEVLGEPASSFEPVKLVQEDTIERQLGRWESK